MLYPVELLLTRADCDAIIADTNDDIARVEFRITSLNRSATLRIGDATKDAADIAALTDQITPLEARIPAMPAGEARTKQELKLRSLRRQREELEDDQLKQGARTVFRRNRELDAAQRELAALQECVAQTTARRTALPA
jgi:chromosome segregation ATPase